MLTIVSDTVRETRRTRAREQHELLEQMRRELRELREEAATTNERIAGVEGVVRGITSGKLDRRVGR